MMLSNLIAAVKACRANLRQPEILVDDGYLPETITFSLKRPWELQVNTQTFDRLVGVVVPTLDEQLDRDDELHVIAIAGAPVRDMRR